MFDKQLITLVMITLGIVIVDGPKIVNQQKIFYVRESVSIIISIINGTNKKIQIPVQVNESKILTTLNLAPKSKTFFLKNSLRNVHGNGAKFSN